VSIPRLSNVLESILIDALGLPAAATQVRLLRSWGEIVGPLLGGKTAPGKIRNGVLTVFVPNHAWAQELQLSQPALLEKIRSVAGEGKVREIRFTVGPGEVLPAVPAAGSNFPRADGRPPEADEGHDVPPVFEPSDLEGVRDPETREILRSICRKSSRRKK
jgi:predicted nucleic acid-binding Zn ribbon protein